MTLIVIRVLSYLAFTSYVVRFLHLSSYVYQNFACSFVALLSGLNHSESNCKCGLNVRSRSNATYDTIFFSSFAASSNNFPYFFPISSNSFTISPCLSSSFPNSFPLPPSDRPSLPLFKFSSLSFFTFELLVFFAENPTSHACSCISFHASTSEINLLDLPELGGADPSTPSNRFRTDLAGVSYDNLEKSRTSLFSGGKVSGRT